MPGDLKYKGWENNDGHVLSSCAFMLAPVKQELLESTISLKEKQQQCVKIM